MKKNELKKTLSTTATAFFGVIVFAIIGSIVYSQVCERCKSVEPIPDNISSAFLEDELARDTAILTTVDGVTEWNQYAVGLTMTVSPAPAPIQQTRILAIVHVSVHDAVNGVTNEYETYLPKTYPPAGASAEAAAIAAAYRTLNSIFGNGPFAVLGNRTLNQVYLDSLAAHGLTESDPGIGYGTAAADAILAVRSTDGAAQAQYPYDGPNTDPGTWRLLPGQTASLPGWGNVTPFVLRSGSQFRPEAPPALDSEEYARDYNEIKEIGSSNSTMRTPQQSQIAQFWRASPTAIWNPVLRQALAHETFDLSTTARAFALFYLAAADASIACWDAKYAYNFWRPQSAIRRGDVDGNDSTIGDPSWTPYVATPPHPEYPSGHATNSSAMASVLESIFGKSLDTPIVVTVSGITREWGSFDEGVEEVIDARVYSGIHFRNSDITGARQGRQVAQFVLIHALRPCTGKRAQCT